MVKMTLSSFYPYYPQIHYIMNNSIFEKVMKHEIMEFNWELHYF